MKLTAPQRLIYDAEKYIGSSVSVMCGVMTVERPCPEARVVDAIRQIYRTNDALNLRLDDTGDEPVLYMTDPEAREIPVVRVDDVKELEAIGQAAAVTPFDLKGPLSDLRAVVYPGGYGIVLRVHHLLGDAWSMSLIGTQLNEIIEGKQSERYSFVEYAASRDEYLTSKRCAKDRAYFLERFDRCPEPVLFAGKSDENYDAAFLRLALSAGTRGALSAFARENDMTETALLFGLFALFFAKYRGCPDAFFIGMPVLGRVSEKDLHTVGMYVNTAPVLIRPDYRASLRDNLLAVSDEILSVFRHQRYNYGQLLRELRAAGRFSDRLYDVLVNFQSDEIFADADMLATEYSRRCQAETLQLVFNHRNGEDGLVLDYIYRTALLTENEVRRIHACLTTAAAILLETPDLPLTRLGLVPDAPAFLRRYAEGPAAPIPEKSLYAAFRETAEHLPLRTALVAGDRRLSFRELLHRIDAAADRLSALGIGPGDVTAIRLERGEALFILQLAVLKRGAVFLPTDKRFPAERLRRLCRACGVKLLLCDDPEKPKIDGVRVLTLRELTAVSPEGPTPEAVRDAAYIIHTSGSTGEPKGCLLLQRGLLNFCLNNNTLPALRKQDHRVFACVNSVSFDYFIAESLLPLLNGYTVVLFGEEEGLRRELFLARAAEYGVDVLMTTPTRLSLYYEGEEAHSALGALQVVCSSGEPLPKALLQRIFERSPDADVFNPLGPSECTVWDLGGELRREAGTDVHLGRPIANTSAYILDKYLQPVPVGVPGELCLAGAGVGAGYPGDPEKTAEKFVDNPFGTGKLYRTGDLAALREDGNVAYIGRLDTQLKLRGQRIEAGEIEAALRALDGIDLAAATVLEKDGEQLLCAFYTGEKRPVDDLRSALSVTLPGYMIPHSFTHLDRMPLTVSGKTDRRALSDTVLETVSPRVGLQPPETAAETVLCQAAAELTGETAVGVSDNFFSLGGDSIKAIHLASMLERRGYRVAVPDIMKSETLGTLAKKMIPINGPAQPVRRQAPERCPFPPILCAYLRNAPTDAEGFSQAVVLRVDCEEALLRRALDAVAGRHDMLRAVTEESGFRIREDGSAEAYRFRSVPFVGDETETVAFLKDRTVRFDLKNGPLTDVLFCPRETGGLCRLTVHHFITDLVSWEILLTDLFAVIDALMAGRAVRLPEPTLPYAIWATEETQNESAFPAAAVRGAKAFPRDVTMEEEARAALLPRTELEPFLRGNDGPQTLRDALLAATGLAAYERLGGDAVILCESHGRTPEVSGTVGWFTKLIPVVFRSPDCAEARFTAAEALRKGPDPGFARLLRETGLPASCRILFNFYNNATLEKTLGGRLVCRIAGQSRFPGVIAVDCFLTQDGVQLEFFQPAGAAPRGTAGALAGLIPVYLKKLAGTDGVRASGYSDDTLTAAELQELQDLF